MLRDFRGLPASASGCLQGAIPIGPITHRRTGQCSSRKCGSETADGRPLWRPQIKHKLARGGVQRAVRGFGLLEMDTGSALVSERCVGLGLDEE